VQCGGLRGNTVIGTSGRQRTSTSVSVASIPGTNPRARIGGREPQLVPAPLA
jgi:hypothetical protein